MAHWQCAAARAIAPQLAAVGAQRSAPPISETLACRMYGNVPYTVLFTVHRCYTLAFVIYNIYELLDYYE